MDRRLLTDEELERSGVVANCRMNRERGVVGRNSYAADLRVDPLDFLRERLDAGRSVAWLDLCCGTGRALVQAARRFTDLGVENRVAIHGLDLVDMFDPAPEGISCLAFQAVPLRSWSAAVDYDLVTCVHGLHYVGDKLGVVSRAASWLKPDGLFLAHLDLGNLKLTTGRWMAGQVGRHFKSAGMTYDRRHRLLRRRGKRIVELPYRYEGADDTAGPNFTGQAAVDSYYSPSSADS